MQIFMQRIHGCVCDVRRPDLLPSSLPVLWLRLVFGQHRKEKKLFISVGDQTLQAVLELGSIDSFRRTEPVKKVISKNLDIVLSNSNSNSNGAV